MQWGDAGNTYTIRPVVSGSVTFGRVTAGVTVNNPWNSRPILSQSGQPTATSTRHIYQAQHKVGF